jgi:hypothetical protein
MVTLIFNNKRASLSWSTPTCSESRNHHERAHLEIGRIVTTDDPADFADPLDNTLHDQYTRLEGHAVSFGFVVCETSVDDGRVRGFQFCEMEIASDLPSNDGAARTMVLAVKLDPEDVQSDGFEAQGHQCLGALECRLAQAVFDGDDESDRVLQKCDDKTGGGTSSGVWDNHDGGLDNDSVDDNDEQIIPEWVLESETDVGLRGGNSLKAGALEEYLLNQKDPKQELRNLSTWISAERRKARDRIHLVIDAEEYVQHRLDTWK